MTSAIQAELVNGPFGDPALVLDLAFERRALLFDIGDVAALGTRKLLRVSDVFVSHAHMDHFAGFDRMLRVRLGRDASVALWGPPGFTDRVEAKLGAYTWNVIGGYATEFVVTVHEVGLGWSLRTARFGSRSAFAREPLGERSLPAGELCRTPGYTVRAAFLDHRTPCLAFCLVEADHINIWKPRLEALGLPTGPWLTELRRAIREGAPAETPIKARWRDRDGAREREFTVAELVRDVVELTPGQRIAYATDATMTEENAARIVALARDADLLFIEAAFLEADRDHALRKAHMTAAFAGRVAATSGARRAVPFHFSTRYLGGGHRLAAEFEAARAAAMGWQPPSGALSSVPIRDDNRTDA
ncbi:MAG: MBL fold metallo-hydrolase [Steroidobacteraceae bacterium]|jgi:ribonuclease Z|nr:MBL fold metallo-hydrolase [Steroidobacteraceae bacterium]